MTHLRKTPATWEGRWAAMTNAGNDASPHTVVVLTGRDADAIERYPFRPNDIVNTVADLPDPTVPATGR